LGTKQEKLRRGGDEIIISLSGYDESLSQTIHARILMSPTKYLQRHSSTISLNA